MKAPGDYYFISRVRGLSKRLGIALRIKVGKGVNPTVGIFFFRDIEVVIVLVTDGGLSWTIRTAFEGYADNLMSSFEVMETATKANGKPDLLG